MLGAWLGRQVTGAQDQPAERAATAPGARGPTARTQAPRLERLPFPQVHLPGALVFNGLACRVNGNAIKSEGRVAGQ